MFVQRSVFVVFAVAGVTLAFVPSAGAQSNSKEIMALDPAKLVELLQNPSASAFEKAKACQRLAVAGTKDAIPALVALLPDEHLNLYARFGLEGIPDPAVDDALREAVTKLKGRQQAGVINSIGQRHDAKAVDLLKGLLGRDDQAVAAASARALGRIGNVEAAAVLKAALAKDSAVKQAIGEGCLACADGLAAADKKSEAVALLEAVAQVAELPKQLRTAAIAGQLRLRQSEGKDLLLKQIQTEDESFFHLGLAAAREIPGAEVTEALIGVLDKLPAERQALLLRALGDRGNRKAGGETYESTVLPVVETATKSQSPVVSEAAVAVLARIGGPRSVAILLDIALGGGPVAAAATDGLKNTTAPKVDETLVARLADADAKAKVVLFEIASARRTSGALPAIRQAATDRNPSVRMAALAALGQLVALDDLALLTGPALTGTNAEEMAAAQGALRTAALRMADREACAAKLAESLPKTSQQGQAYLLGLLGEMSGQKALETVAASAKSSDAALKDSATRVLGDWPNADAAAALLDLAKTDAEAKYRIRALRGFIRIARQLQLPPDKKLDMFHTAMKVAQRNDEKQLALDILSRIPSPETLKLAASYVNEPALKDAAADAAVKIAGTLVGSQPKAVAEAMQKLVDAGVTGNTGNRAKQLLDQAKAAAK